MLLVLSSHPVRAQSTADDIQARLTGQPLYLRGFWAENKLKFDADGRPEKNYKIVPFTAAGIDVRSVNLSGDRLFITGQRVGLEFVNGIPQRIDIKGKGYDGKVTIEVHAVSGADFGKAIDVIFAPNLTSLEPTLPVYWQDYAAKHLGSAGSVNPGVTRQKKRTGRPLALTGTRHMSAAWSRNLWC